MVIRGCSAALFVSSMPAMQPTRRLSGVRRHAATALKADRAIGIRSKCESVLTKGAANRQSSAPLFRHRHPFDDRPKLLKSLRVRLPDRAAQSEHEHGARLSQAALRGQKISRGSVLLNALREVPLPRATRMHDHLRWISEFTSKAERSLPFSFSWHLPRQRPRSAVAPVARHAVAPHRTVQHSLSCRAASAPTESCSMSSMIESINLT